MYSSVVAPGSMIIETATWRDLNALRQIEKECFPKDAWPLWDLVGVLSLPHIVRLKAVMEERMVGFIAADQRPGETLAWIATVAVLPEFQRRGIGRALILDCEKRMDVLAMRLSVRMSNELAIRLYRSLDYKAIEVWPGYYHDHEDALVMEKTLK